VRARAALLKAEAQITLGGIRTIADTSVADPLTDPATLAQAVKIGLLDAPQLRNNPYAAGQWQTRIVDGGCVFIDDDGALINEVMRTRRVLRRKTP
jgi:hypothetical protein